MINKKNLSIFQANKNISQLPNMAFSLALAMFHRAKTNSTDTEHADNMVHLIIFCFRNVFCCFKCFCMFKRLRSYDHGRNCLKKFSLFNRVHWARNMASFSVLCLWRTPGQKPPLLIFKKYTQIQHLTVKMNH